MDLNTFKVHLLEVTQVSSNNLTTEGEVKRAFC